MGIFIFEIDNDTGNIITYVTAKNMTKAVAEAASVLDRAHNATDGIGEVYLFLSRVHSRFQIARKQNRDGIISVSDDGTTFTQKHSGTSSGTTTSPEKYTFTAPAEPVRITVNGNTQNEWASITEIASFGDAVGGGSPSPVPTDPGPMYHRW